MTLHDLRRTVGAMLAGAGNGLPVIGRVLNHASPAATAIYARLDLYPVREPLERNAKLMDLGRHDDADPHRSSPQALMPKTLLPLR